MANDSLSVADDSFIVDALQMEQMNWSPADTGMTNFGWKYYKNLQYSSHSVRSFDRRNRTLILELYNIFYTTHNAATLLDKQ